MTHEGVADDMKEWCNTDIIWICSLVWTKSNARRGGYLCRWSSTTE